MQSTIISISSACKEQSPTMAPANTIKTCAVVSLFCLVAMNILTLHYIVSQNTIYHSTSNDLASHNHLYNSDNRPSRYMNSAGQRRPEPMQWYDEMRKIPRIVHLSWKTDSIPQEVTKWIKRWPETNPNWEVWFWTDASAKDFIAKKFPNTLPIYNNYKLSIFRADAMRYIILYEYGGIWADLDVEPLKSLDPIRDQYACILSKESEVHARMGWHTPLMVCNAFMATRKRHPFFRFLIEMLEVNQKDSHPVASTGPMMITRMYKAYQPLYEALGRNKTWNQVHISDKSTMFLPSVDILAINNLRRHCEQGTMAKSNQYLCNKYLSPDFRNGPTEDSYTDHHWWHSWFGKQKTKKYVNIQEALPNVVLPDKAGKY